MNSRLFSYEVAKVLFRNSGVEQKPKSFLSFPLAAAICLSLASTAFPTEKPQSIDQQLFEDLDEDLFSDLSPIKRETAKKPANEKPSGADVELQRELGGEDLGKRRATNPLENIAESMRTVRDRLAKKNATAETQRMQSRIVERFDELIAQLKKQKQQKSGKGSSSQNSKPSSQPKPGAKPGQGKPNTQSHAPAPDSTTRLGQAEPAEATPAERDQLMQKAWGNLPAAQQRQMQSAHPERFLPKYSRLIEDYFKRLAEDLDK